MKFIACRNLANVKALSIEFDKALNPEIKEAPPAGHIPVGMIFTIGKAEVVDELSASDKEKVLWLSHKGGAKYPGALPILPVTEKMVASVQKIAKAKAARVAKAAAEQGPGLLELLGSLLEQNAALLAQLAGKKAA